MGYSFTSALGSTPEERLKTVEGFQEKAVKRTSEEANAWLVALRESGKPIIFNKVTGTDVFSYCVNSKGDRELTPEDIADLRSRYDFDNLTKEGYEALLAELNMMGVLRHTQTHMITDIPTEDGIITLDALLEYISNQADGFRYMLGLLKASPNPSLIAIDDVEKSVEGCKKLARIMSQLLGE